MATNPSIVVVGSVNLDLAATVERLPVAGETVTGAAPWLAPKALESA